jgi:hypothetical protein
MVDYKTIRIPAEDYEQAKQSKRDSETWGEFVQRCTDEPPEVRELVDFAEVGSTLTDDIATTTAKEIVDKEMQRIEQQATDTESIDYAEIESRLERVLKEVLR